VKKRHDRTIAICDAGLNMVRSMNSWRHSVELLDEGINSVAAELYGSNCFESDMICSQLPLDITQSGQIALVRGCGGYDIPSTNYWLRSASAIYATRSGEVSTAREQQPLHSFRSRDLTNV